MCLFAIPAVARIEHTVVAVFDAPMVADVGQQFRCTGTFEASHAIADLAAVPTHLHDSVAVNPR